MLTIVLVYRDEQGKKNQYQNCTFYFFDDIIIWWQTFESE